jgi:hypothetical protein
LLSASDLCAERIRQHFCSNEIPVLALHHRIILTDQLCGLLNFPRGKEQQSFLSHCGQVNSRQNVAEVFGFSFQTLSQIINDRLNQFAIWTWSLDCDQKIRFRSEGVCILLPCFGVLLSRIHEIAAAGAKLQLSDRDPDAATCDQKNQPQHQSWTRGDCCHCPAQESGGK